MRATLGCARCYGEDAAAAWTWFREGMDVEHTIVDDSHFVVSVRRCRACGQAFVSVFIEFVDWLGGEDAQYRDVLPVSAPEVSELIEYGESVDRSWLGSLGRDRRRLSIDWPTGAPCRREWRHGVFAVRPAG